MFLPGSQREFLPHLYLKFKLLVSRFRFREHIIFLKVSRVNDGSKEGHRACLFARRQRISASKDLFSRKDWAEFNDTLHFLRAKVFIAGQKSSGLQKATLLPLVRWQVRFFPIFHVGILRTKGDARCKTRELLDLLNMVIVRHSRTEDQQFIND